MSKNFSMLNLQEASFRNEDLSYAYFYNSDLRGADFTGSNLTGADFTHVKTGITPVNTMLIFVVALTVSLFSGYLAMLAGDTVQSMIASKEVPLRNLGFAAMIMAVIFIGYSWWKGIGNAVKNLVLPCTFIALVIALGGYFTGVGIGVDIIYLVLACYLVALMFVVGTIARAAADGLSSNFLFLMVALAGGMFGKSLGGEIGSVVMAVSSAHISKRALSGAKGFEALRKIVAYITSKLGTSFRNTRLADADFSRANIQNTDFSHADVSLVNWEDSQKINCLLHNQIVTEKKN